MKSVLPVEYFEHTNIMKLLRQRNKKVVQNLGKEFYASLVIFVQRATAEPDNEIVHQVVTAGLMECVEYLRKEQTESEDYVIDLYRIVKLKAIEVLYSDSKREEMKSWDDRFFLAFGVVEVMRKTPDKESLRARLKNDVGRQPK